ncbi:glycosyltransferase [Pelagibius sp. Alg239-R121]|uniref:glycosyltransferase n=1 Tax=Pelagibius sp. Alg239-R121 TaxID=2993448 RepID=UPI0024A6C359|nr:glycosyltransferase [Pelagibius sp. Alg239-R121]
MKILIFTMGSRGDVQPYVALGAALRGLGHSVTISTGEGFDEMIEAEGLTVATVSVDFRALINSPDLREALHSFSGKIKAWRKFKPLMRQHYDDMWQIAQDVKPDLYIYHPKGSVARLIAEAQQVPAIATSLQPTFVPTEAFPVIFTPFADLGGFGNRLSHHLFNALAAWGQSNSFGSWGTEILGITGSGKRDFFDGYDPTGRVLPRLHGYSRHIVPKPKDWPEREQVTGYWFSEPVNDWTPPEPLANFLGAGPPPVYVGFGSMPAEDAERQTRVVIDALELSGHRGILATGWGGLKDLTNSSDIHLLESAPHSWLFPRCSAVVHHGGAGTTHEGLRWGRPSVVCPLTVDQPFWGRRVKALGAGPAPLPQKRLNATDLAKALEAAHQHAITSRAKETAEMMHEECGAQKAAEVIGRTFC